MAVVTHRAGALVDQSDIAHAWTNVGELPRAPAGLVVGARAQLPCDGRRVFEPSQGRSGRGEEILGCEGGFPHDLGHDAVLEEPCLQLPAEMGGVLVDFGLFFFFAEQCRLTFKMTCARGGNRNLSLNSISAGHSRLGPAKRIHLFRDDDKPEARRVLEAILGGNEAVYIHADRGLDRLVAIANPQGVAKRGAVDVGYRLCWIDAPFCAERLFESGKWNVLGLDLSGAWRRRGDGDESRDHPGPRPKSLNAWRGADDSVADLGDWRFARRRPVQIQAVSRVFQSLSESELELGLGNVSDIERRRAVTLHGRPLALCPRRGGRCRRRCPWVLRGRRARRSR